MKEIKECLHNVTSQETEYANEIIELIKNNPIEMTSKYLIRINKVPQVPTVNINIVLVQYHFNKAAC